MAQEPNLCEPDGPGAHGGHIIFSSYHPRGGVYSIAASRPPVNLHVAVTIGDDGLSLAAGSAQVHDGASNTVFLSERHLRPLLTCDDVDGDGHAGLTAAHVGMRHAVTGEPVLVTVLPVDGEIDESGVEWVTLVIETATSVQTIQTRQVTIIQDI